MVKHTSVLGNTTKQWKELNIDKGYILYMNLQGIMPNGKKNQFQMVVYYVIPFI